MVLNAFRHQRINHERVKARLKRVASAQRLSASKDKSRSLSPIPFPPPTGAQRLSASKDKSLDTISGSLVEPHVLNAFRHQRINHLDDLAVKMRDHVCSTPFGIKG